jgi:hypothetical protein
MENPFRRIQRLGLAQDVLLDVNAQRLAEESFAPAPSEPIELR